MRAAPRLHAVCFAVSAIWLGAARTVAVQSPVITIEPSSTSVMPGDTVEVRFRVSDLGANALSGFDLDVTFDPTLFSLTSASFSDPTTGANQLDIPESGAMPFVGSTTLVANGLDVIGLSGNSAGVLHVQQPVSFFFLTLKLTSRGPTGTSVVGVNSSDPSLLILDANAGDLPATIRAASIDVVNKATFLLIDQDGISSNAPAIRDLAAAGLCGAGDAGACVNWKLAGPGIRAILPLPVGTCIGSQAAVATGKCGNSPTSPLLTGRVGTEGWFALKTIPSSWDLGVPGTGLKNYIALGHSTAPPGLGDAEGELLKQVPDVTPLRGDGIGMLVGRQVCAVAYEKKIDIHYSPTLYGRLKGATLGIVAFEVLSAQRASDAPGFLPEVTIRILDAAKVCGRTMDLLTDAPRPISASQPQDLNP